MLSLEFFYRFLLSPRAGSLVKSISRISITGIWLGVTALIVVVSVMNGFNKSIQARLLEVEPHLVVEVDGITDVSQLLDHPVYKKIQSVETKLIAPISYQDVIMRTTDGFVQGAIAAGITKERLKQLIEYGNKKAGSIDPEVVEKINNLKSGEIILGVGLADSIGLFRDDSVVLIPPETLLLPSGEIPQLSQAVVKGFLMTDIERIDGKTFYYLIDESFPRLRTSVGRQLALELWLNDADQAKKIKAQLTTGNVRIETWEERNASLFFALKIEKLVVSFLVGLSTLIAGLSIISVMVMLLTQKRKDIGNLLAMGMTRTQTMNTFIFIGMFLSLTGIIGGTITGVLLSFSVDSFSQDVLPAFYEETNIPADVRISQILIIVFIGVSSSFVALRMTMKKLSSFRPSEILRG